MHFFKRGLRLLSLVVSSKLATEQRVESVVLSLLAGCVLSINLCHGLGWGCVMSTSGHKPGSWPRFGAVKLNHADLAVNRQNDKAGHVLLPDCFVYKRFLVASVIHQKLSSHTSQKSHQKIIHPLKHRCLLLIFVRNENSLWYSSNSNSFNLTLLLRARRPVHAVG